MEDMFKVPSLDTKVKFIPKKPKEPAPIETDISNEGTDPPIQNTSDVPKQNSTSSRCRPKCSYVEPEWSGKPTAVHKYQIEVLKNGTIAETVNELESKSYWLLGKLPENDIVMAHPTISRFHAVLQYRPNVSSRLNSNDSDSDSEDEAEGSTTDDNATPKKPQVEKGWYLYDLNSTHGSFVNKMRVPPKTYVRVRVGYMIKFGGSTRNYILQGPDFDAEDESELTVTQIKELRRQKEAQQQLELVEAEKKKEDEGISWGMAEDADEETDLSHNPFALTNNEELFLNDPKKTLRGFFEREGCDLDYKVDELANGSFLCRIELPISDSNGRAIIAEVSHKGKKKDCVLQGALEACRILDRHGVLRQANHEPMKRRKIESSDDDDDEFYDRTAEADEKRKRKASDEQTVAKTYEELLTDEQVLLENISSIEAKMSKYQSDKKAKEQSEEDDGDLDDFMSNLTNEKQLDKTEIRKLRFDLQRMKGDHVKLQRLIRIARPVELPPLLAPATADSAQPLEAKKKFALPLFGKKGTFNFRSSLPAKKPKLNEAKPQSGIIDGPEEEEDEEEKQETDTPSMMDVDKHRKPDSTESQGSSTQKSETKSPAKPEIPEKREKIIDTPASAVIDDEAGSSTKRKRNNRNRNRNRNKNHRMDYDESEELTDSTKYSGWVPPQDQQGDGMTDLNSKFGY